MLRAAALTLAGLMLAAIPALAATQPESVREEPAFRIQLLSRNGSTMTGTARFVRRGKRSFVVIVRTRGGPGAGETGYPAHVHTGPCSKEPTFQNPRIKYGLNYVRRGFSRTTVNRPYSVFRRRVHSLNVHEPSGEMKAIACGDLPLRY